jgi:uncharacterized protein YciI
MFFAVTLTRGGPWDWSYGLREQQGFAEHAEFMDALVDEGFILLGGPLALEREVLHIIRAPSEQEVRARLAQDPWHQNGMLTITSLRSWTVLLDGLGATGSRAGS